MMMWVVNNTRYTKPQTELQNYDETVDKKQWKVVSLQ